MAPFSHSARRGVSFLALCAALGGCAVGPNFHRPGPPEGASYAGAPGAQADASAAGGGEPAIHQSFDPGADIPAEWWSLFQSKPLDALVRRALAANPDLKAAQAALRVAQENLKAARGAYLPSADGQFTSTRAKNPVTLASPLLSNANLYTLYTAQLNVSYVLDVFGGTRRQVESVAAQAEMQRFQTEAAYLTLTSNVVVAAFDEADLRAQVQANRRIVEIETRILDILRGRERLGDMAHADVLAQEAALAQAVQALPPLQKALAQQQNMIAALAGRLPNAAPDETFDLASFTLPQTIPLSLPARLVDQRPDIRAAEANLHAAAADVGVAVAARLPTLTLSASGGGSSTGLGSLFTSDNTLWSVTGGVAQPIFQGGALRHRQRAAEAAYDQAKAQYRSAVITGYQNVSDALAALRTDADALSAAMDLERAAGRSLAVAEGQLRLGQIPAYQVLTAEQAYRQAESALQQARAARLTDTAALFQALGGGWWSRPASGKG